MNILIFPFSWSEAKMSASGTKEFMSSTLIRRAFS